MVLDMMFDTFSNLIFQHLLQPSQNIPLIILRVLWHLNSVKFAFVVLHIFIYFHLFHIFCTGVGGLPKG